MPFFVKTDSLFLSTPSARRATHICVGKRGEVWDFYPRPPRGGRPRPDPLWTGCRRNFYPRPPRGGRLLLAPGYLSTSSNFYPRPPRGGRRSAVRGATWRIFYFYPRPPRGGRPDTDGAQIGFICISIHALREEGDFCLRRGICLPRPISIHALREEGDGQPSGERHGEFFISIHALREEGDPTPMGRRLDLFAFLSTPSARRATCIQ